jgi:hypothetical protein
VGLAVHESRTFGVPVPEKLCVTSLMLLLNVTFPAAGPGEPEGGENFTLNCCFCPAKIVKGRAGRPETEKPLPTGVSPVMVTSAPMAASVPVWDELSVPSGMEPKLKFAGLMLRPDPVPDRVTAGGVFEALLVKARVPDAVPGVDGAKLMPKVELLPEVIVSGKLIPLSIKPPALRESAVIVRSPLVTFRVPVCTGLVVPTLIPVKLKLDGVMESCPDKMTKLAV